MHFPRTRLATALLVATAIGATTPAPMHAASASPASHATTAFAWGAAEEQAFVGRINALRTGKGLAPLEVDPELTAASRTWAETMRQRGTIFHASDLSVGVTSNWQKLGENVGVGGTVDALFDAFVASPKHYENLVDPVYRYVGVGVVWDGDRMFTTHRFMALFPPEETTTTEAPRATIPAELPAVDPVDPPTTTTTAPTTTTTTTTAPPTPPPAERTRIAAIIDAITSYLG